jgi:hypothetical protein
MPGIKPGMTGRGCALLSEMAGTSPAMTSEVTQSVILRCEPCNGEPRRMSAAEMLLALLPRRGRRPSRLAALAPQGDGAKTVRASIKDGRVSRPPRRCLGQT